MIPARMRNPAKTTGRRVVAVVLTLAIIARAQIGIDGNACDNGCSLPGRARDDEDKLPGL